MGAPFNDVGLVVSRRVFGESDRILTLLTREHGKVGVIARGSRKPTARHAGGTDLFTLSDVQMVRGKGSLLVLTGAQRRSGLEFGNAAQAAAAAVCAEIADSLIADGQPIDAEVFDLVSAALAACAGSRPAQAVVWLGLRLCALLGYAPEVTACAVCGNELAPVDAWYEQAAGGLVEDACRGAGDSARVRCPVGVIKVLRVIARADADLFDRLALDAGALATLEAVTRNAVEAAAERRLRSWPVYDSCRL